MLQFMNMMRIWRNGIGRRRRRDYLDAAILVGQEANPTGSGHRFGADDSVLPAGIPDFDRYRFCHLRSGRDLSLPKKRWRGGAPGMVFVQYLYIERKTRNLLFVLSF